MNYRIKATQNISRHCMVCGIDNPFGLKARFHETTDNEVVALFHPQQCHQSYPNVTHGGISAAILDEVIGRAIMAFYDRSTFGVTVELSVKYRRPVPYGCELKAIGRITEDNGRLFAGTGEIYLPDGTLAVTAEGTYMKRQLGQITDEEFVASAWFIPEDFPEEISF